MPWHNDEDRREEDQQDHPEVQLLDRPRQLEQSWQQAEELFQPQLDQQEIVRLKQTDEQLWHAVNHGGDVLGGMSFEDAVSRDPLRVEALIHQRIHNEFFEAMGASAAQRRAMSAMGIDVTPFGQLQAFLDRNTAYRQLHGHLTAATIADSLHRNWEQFSVLLTKMLFQAGANHPVGQAMLNFYVQNWDRLSRAFREAQEIAHRAARVCEHSGKREDMSSWRSVAAAIRDMADFVDKAIHAPRRPAQAGLAPMGGLGQAGHRRQRQAPARRAPIPESRRIAPTPAVVEGPRALTIVTWAVQKASIVQSEDPDSGATIWSYLGKKGTPEAIVTIDGGDSPPRLETVRLTWLGKDRGRPIASLVRCRLRWFLSQVTDNRWPDRIEGLLRCDANFGPSLVHGTFR